MTDKQAPASAVPPRVRIRLKGTDYYAKDYGGDVVLEEHVDPLWSREKDWPQYLSLQEHEYLLATARNEARAEFLDGEGPRGADRRWKMAAEMAFGRALAAIDALCAGFWHSHRPKRSLRP